MSRQATAAIVKERLRRDRVTALLFAALCAAIAFVQRFEDDWAHIAGAIMFVTLAACAAALLIRSVRHRELTLLEIAAPVYGRELARAHAITASVLTTCALAGYWAVSAAYHKFVPGGVVLSAFCAYAACLIVLFARVSATRARVAAAAAVIALCTLSFVFASEWLPAAAACAAAGFLALRSYGEVLARG